MSSEIFIAFKIQSRVFLLRNLDTQTNEHLVKFSEYFFAKYEENSYFGSFEVLRVCAFIMN